MMIYHGLSLLLYWSQYFVYALFIAVIIFQCCMIACLYNLSFSHNRIKITSILSFHKPYNKRIFHNVFFWWMLLFYTETIICLFSNVLLPSYLYDFTYFYNVSLFHSFLSHDNVNGVFLFSWLHFDSR